MIRAIKLESYRMLRSRSTYILLGLLSLCIVFLMSNLHFNYQKWQQHLSFSTANFGLNYEQSFFQVQMTVRDVFCLIVSSRIVLIFLVIFLYVYLKKEQEAQFTQLLAGYFPNKSAFVISKLFCQLLFLLLAFVLVLIIGIVIGPLIFPHFQNSLSISFLMDFDLQLFFHLVFATILLAVFTWGKNLLVNLVLGIILCFGGLDYISDQLFGVENSSLTKMIQHISATSSISDIWQSLGIASVVIIVLLTSLYFQQRKVRL